MPHARVRVRHACPMHVWRTRFVRPAQRLAHGPGGPGGGEGCTMDTRWTHDGLTMDTRWTLDGPARALVCMLRVRAGARRQVPQRSMAWAAIRMPKRSMHAWLLLGTVEWLGQSSGVAWLPSWPRHSCRRESQKGLEYKWGDVGGKWGRTGGASVGLLTGSLLRGTVRRVWRLLGAVGRGCSSREGRRGMWRLCVVRRQRWVGGRRVG